MRFTTQSARTALVCSAFLSLAPLAASQTRINVPDGARRDDRTQTLEIAVFDPYGEQLTDLILGATLADGSYAKAWLTTEGTYLVDGVWAKTALEIVSPDWGYVRCELSLPTKRLVVANVVFTSPDQATSWIEKSESGGRKGGGGGGSGGGGGVGAPANDLCGDAITISVPSLTLGTTTGATIDAAPLCGTSITTGGVWYEFTALASGPHTVSTCTGFFGYDTKLSVYTGGCAGLTCVAGNDDSCSGGASGLLSTVNFAGTAGTEYLILVHGFASGTGDFELTLDGPPPPAANDFCDDALPIALGDTVSGTTDGATIDAAPFCGTSITAPGVWYRYDAASSGEVIATTCGPFFDYDTKISVYSGSCAGLICVAGNDDSCTGGASGLLSTVQWTASAGSSYFILMHGFASGVGDFMLTLTTPPQPPPNDLCADAIPIDVPSTTSGTTILATIDSEFGLCGTAITSPGVWYVVEGTGTTMTAATCGGPFGYDTKISVYCGTCDDALCVAGNDDSCVGGASGLLSTVTWCSQSGATYLILVHGFGGATGAFDLILSEDGVPCTPDVACIPTGACCLLDGTCVDGITEADCVAGGGEYQGDGVACEGGFLGYVIEDCDSDFEDISLTGSDGPFGDDAGITVPIGFTFEFWGVDHTMIGISTNGYLGFDGILTDFSNDPCATTATPNDAIFAYWDDFNLLDGGQIKFQTLGAAPNRRFVCSWIDVAEFATGGADTATFQAVLYEADSSVELRVLSLDGVPDFAGDATIGLENPGGTEAACVADADMPAGACKRFTAERSEPVECLPDCVTLDFQTEDDFATPLVNGQDISTPPEFGNFVSISSMGTNAGAAIFDSTIGGPNDPGQDCDLLVDTGNLLILQALKRSEQSVPGIFDEPDDADVGGALIFDFDRPIEAQSVDLSDIDVPPGIQDGLVTLIDGAGRARVYTVPSAWTSDICREGGAGYGTLDLTTLADQPGFAATATATQDAGFDATDVFRIEVFLSASGGVDNLAICAFGIL